MMTSVNEIISKYKQYAKLRGVIVNDMYTPMTLFLLEELGKMKSEIEELRKETNND